MNFKPNLLKSIVSIASGILVDYFITRIVECVCATNTPCKCSELPWLENAFDPVPFVISLAIIGIVYSIWSFIQKKK